MDRLIRVDDRKEAGGVLDMPTVLAPFVPDGHAWTWVQQVVPWVTVEPGWDFSLSTLEEQMSSSRTGLKMTFGEIERFAGRIFQLLDGEFLATDAPGGLPKPSDDGSVVGRTALAGLAMIDSSFWLIGGPEGVVERARSLFSDTEELDPAAWNRSEQWEPSADRTN